jgi:hypothetical protein
MDRLSFILWSFVAVARPHDGVAVFTGTLGTAGDVLVLDDQGRESRPSELQGIVLLPLELAGRTRLDELRPERPRLVCDVPGATRVRLPSDNGCLYRYRRDKVGGAVFGFFVVPSDGRAENVLELRGTGPLGSDDPVATRVAVDPEGEAFLIGTSLAAGGDVLEIDIEDARAVNRTASLPPQRIPVSGVLLLSEWGLALTDAGVLRFATNSDAPAEFVRAEGGWPGWIGSELVSSADESSVAFVAGSAPARAQIFVLDRSHDARAVTEHEAPLSGAGFLPEQDAGPTLALSTDGSHVAWRTEGLEREAWVRTTNAHGGPELHITGDADFEDTLNDTGVIAFHSRDELTLFVGEGNATDALAEADLFRVRVEAAGTLAIADLSRTNERAERPFGYGRLSLADGFFRLPGAPTWLVRDPGALSDQAQLLWIDGQRNVPLALLARAGPMDELQAHGSVLYGRVRGTTPISPQRFLRLDVERLELCTWPLAPGAGLTRFAAAANELAAILVKPDGERLGRIGSTCGPGVLLSDEPREFGPTLALANGVLYATVRVGGTWSVLAWSDSRVKTLRAGLSAGFLLPGA